jgi:hypothetical protein
LGVRSPAPSASGQRRAISHEGLEDTSLRVGAFTDRAQAALRGKELGLGLSTRELPVRQDQGRSRNPSSPRSRVRIFGRAGSEKHGATGLFERPFRVLGVVACLELAEPVFELRGWRLGLGRVG